MAYFDISEDDIRSLDGQVAVITGASSGIGQAIVQLFLSKGATVIGIDINPPTEPIDSPNFEPETGDVTSWPDLSGIWHRIFNRHRRIDIVCANAGIGPREDFLSLQQDDNGNLIDPSKLVLDVNLKSVINQAALAIHYMRQQDPPGGNIVLTSSCTGYQRFQPVDYCTAKHGVIGLLRSLSLNLNTPEIPIRINAVAPSWTISGLVRLPVEEFEALGIQSQPASAVAKSIGFLVTDQSRHGQCLYSYGGRYVEMEEPIQGAMLTAIGKTGLAEDDDRKRVYARALELGASVR